MNKIKQLLVEYPIELAQLALMAALIVLLPWYASLLAIAVGIGVGYVLAIFKESHQNYSDQDENADGTR